MKAEALSMRRRPRHPTSVLLGLALLPLLTTAWSSPALADEKHADPRLHWDLKLFGPDGKEVPRKLLDEGIRRDLVIGAEYRITGRIPVQIMRQLKGASGLEIAFESRPDDKPDNWTVHNHIRPISVDASTRNSCYTTTFTVSAIIASG